MLSSFGLFLFFPMLSLTIFFISSPTESFFSSLTVSAGRLSLFLSLYMPNSHSSATRDLILCLMRPSASWRLILLGLICFCSRKLDLRRSRVVFWSSSSVSRVWCIGAARLSTSQGSISHSPNRGFSCFPRLLDDFWSPPRLRCMWRNSRKCLQWESIWNKMRQPIAIWVIYWHTRRLSKQYQSTAHP